MVDNASGDGSPALAAEVAREAQVYEMSENFGFPTAVSEGVSQRHAASGSS